MGQDNDEADYTKEDIKTFADKCDTEKILKNLPAVKKTVAEHYLKNTKMMRNTFKMILDRKLENHESERMRVVCFDMAVSQTAYHIRKSTGISDEDLKLMAETCDKQSLIEVMENALTKVENRRKN